MRASPMSRSARVARAESGRYPRLNESWGLTDYADG